MYQSWSYWIRIQFYLVSIRKSYAFSILYLLQVFQVQTIVQILISLLRPLFFQNTRLFLKYGFQDDIRNLHRRFYWDKWNICIIRFEQLCESSVRLKTINTSEWFKSLWNNHMILWLLWSTERQCSSTVSLFHCRNLLQYF